MRWMKLIVVLAMAVAVTGVANAGDDLKIGSAGAQELRIPAGSRGTAMGGSAVALNSGLDAIYWNPAGASDISGTDLMFSRRKYIADIDIDYFAMARRMGDVGIFGVTAKILSMNDEPVRTVDFPDGTGEMFSSSFSVVGLTYSRRMTDRVALGINTNIIYERIADQSATGFALDVGFTYDPGWNNMTFGAVIKNLGPKMRFDGPGFDLETETGSNPNALPHNTRSQAAEFEIPSYVQMGAAYQMVNVDRNVVNLTGTFQSNNFAQDEWRIGGEYIFDELLSIRGGYSYSDQKDYLYGATFGAGLAFELGETLVNFDYAWSQSEFFDDNQYFTFQLGF